MVTIETIVSVMEDGTITAQVPGTVPRGRHRAVIVLDTVALDKDSMEKAGHRGFPDMAPFREALGASSYPGNTILEMREPSRWDLDRLAESEASEDRDLAEQGLAEWAAALDLEDRT